MQRKKIQVYSSSNKIWFYSSYPFSSYVPRLLISNVVVRPNEIPLSPVGRFPADQIKSIVHRIKTMHLLSTECASIVKMESEEKRQ